MDYSATKLPFKWVLLGLVVALVVLGAGYWFLKPQTQITNDQINSNVQNSSSQTADWKTYKNDQYGFEMKYPVEWIIENNENGLILFMSNSTKLLREKNTQDCLSASGNCSPDGIPADVVLNITTTDTTEIIESNGEVAFNGMTFTKYLGPFAGEQHFIATYSNQDFDFMCTSPSVCTQILSTFKFTK